MKYRKSDGVPPTETLGSQLTRVFGANSRRLRLEAGCTLEDFGFAACQQGLKFSRTGRVSDLESGRVEAKLATVLAIAQAHANVSGKPVSVADLFAGSEFAALLSGEPLQPQPDHGHDQDATPTEIARRLGWPDLATAAAEFGVHPDKLGPLLAALDSVKVTDRREAAKLKISVEELTEHAVALWGHALSTERDRQAGPEAGVADLGQITRRLRLQVEARMRARR